MCNCNGEHLCYTHAEEIRASIRRIIRRGRITQRWIALAVGLDQDTVRESISGKNQSNATLVKIAGALGFGVRNGYLEWLQ